MADTYTATPEVALMLDELESLEAELAEVPAKYDRREQLYLGLRAVDPPVPYGVIAERTKAGPEAVRVAVNKARRKASGNPITRRKT